MKWIFYEGIDGWYRSIQTIENKLDKTLDFKVSTSHPVNYRIIPESGTLEPNASFKIQIMLKEVCSDYEKHEITVKFLAVKLINGQRSRTLRSICKIAVELSAKSKSTRNNNEQAVTKENLTNRSLMELEIRRSIQVEDYFLNTESALFPNPYTVPKAIRGFFTRYYGECLIDLLKSNLKSIVTSMMTTNNTQAIEDFRNQRNTLNLQSSFWESFLTKNQRIQLNNMLYLWTKSDSNVEKAGQPIVTSAKKYFDMCVTLFYDEAAETAMQQLLVTWFKSGYMNKAVFQAIKALQGTTISPRALKNIKWRALASDDYYSKNFEQLLQRITVNEFVQKEDLEHIVNTFAFEKTEFKLSQDSPSACALTIIGRIIFLSDVIEKVEEQLKQNIKIYEVQFNAKNVLNIDSNLENAKWHGKNVVIVADKVHVWASHVIDVSGIGYDLRAQKKRAQDGTAFSESGKDGNHGRAGESSGNIVLLTERLLEGDLLTLKLNGGNGEHGEDGGNGADGKNGCGVTKADLDSLILSYSTLYWGGSRHFFDFTPKGTKELFRKVDTYNKYVFARFQDENSREMHWSYAEDYSFLSTSTYDLYFLIKGSQGTAGGVGGLNGVGGEGGNCGDCIVRKLYSGKELQIKNIEKNPGRSGDHGSMGKPGRFGKNGNDMVFIDRSTIAAGKKYIGTEGNMSIGFTYRMNRYNARINGYEKWVVKRSSHYIHFTTHPIKEGAVMKMESELRTNADRESQSKTTSKASIIISNVVSKFAECFEQNDAAFAEACQVLKQANQEENDEDEEKNEQTVAKEISVLLDCVEHDTGLSNLYGSKKSRSIWTELVERIKSYKTSTVDVSVELVLGCFQHEVNADELQSLDAKLKQLTQDVKNVAGQPIEQVSTFDFTQIRTLANNLDYRVEQKKIHAKLRSQKDLLLEKYFNTTVDGNLALNPTTNTLIGVKEGSPYTCEQIDFFNQYEKLGVGSNLLEAMFDAFDYLSRKHGDFLAEFHAGRNFDWNDENAMKNEFERHKVPSTSQGTTLNTNESRLDRLENVLKADAQNLEKVFEKFNEIIKADKSNVLLKRFGLMPTAKIKKEEQEEQRQASRSNTANNQSKENSTGFFSNWRSHLPSFLQSKHATACFTIKFYFQIRQVLTYNRMLYYANILSSAQVLHPGTGKTVVNSVIDVDSPDFTSFIKERKLKPFDVESGECEEFVHKNNINAAVCRFLLAYQNDFDVRVYQEKRYAVAELQENFNRNGFMILSLLSYEGKMYSLQVDSDYRSMVAAREQWTKTTQIPLPESFNLQELHSITNYFTKEYMPTVASWIRIFQVINRPRASVLLSLLQQRFDLDGCQLSIVELQAILSAYSHAAIVCRTDDDFLLKLAVISKQHQILDVFLYVRIENALKRRIDKDRSSQIIEAIHSIDSPHLKALLATKLNDVNFDENILLKVLIMLRYAVDRFHRLEKMTLNEWIDTSKRQKWSTIGELLKDFGSVGYYLAFLDSRNRPEEPMLRKCLQDVAKTRILIPEKIIARIAYLIAYEEVDANEQYFSQLKRLLEVISNNYTDYLPRFQRQDSGVKLSGYPLLMNECNQNDLLGQIKRHHNAVYDSIFPTGERTIEKLRKLIVVQHDDHKRRVERQAEIDQLTLKLNSDQCRNALIINEIDQVIEKHFSKPDGSRIRLRDTQKMAILIAAESDQNTLLQVNTGEGKTLLIATLAIIRARQNKNVDVITSSPVLAARDVEKMQPIFQAFHITASHNWEEKIDSRKLAYKSQIVYGDMQHFQRDFLLHNFYKKNILGDRQRQCVIVDEVDNMLLDNGNNMLYLSHNIAGLETLVSLFVFLHRVVNVPLYGEGQHTQFNSKTIKKQVLSDLFGYIDKESLEKLVPNMRIGVNRVWKKLIQMNVMDRDGLLRIQSETELPNNFISLLESVVSKSFAIKVKDLLCVILHRERLIQVPRYLHFFVLRHLDEFIENAKRSIFMKDKDEYVIDLDHKNTTSDLNPRVTIIDKNTGIDLTTSQWSEGLHQAIQLKHGCRLSPISLKAIFVSNVGYFKGYERINGLSGTLGSVEESKSLISLYDADLVRIPTWKPKNFYEHVPLIAANEAVWLQNIYTEVKDQVIAGRSVLIICNSISQVDKVQHGLEQLHRMEKETVPDRLMTDCFDNLIVYRRDHDEFDLSGSKALLEGRAIIATNLAGRGTDIELSQRLQDAGGLHVIVAFLPDNCRIEDQAFGRAARCGHPGSGQIIALIEDDKRIDASETSTIFQLKEFRDNAEVHRLQSLKRHYDYRTAVEESCLNKFWEHSSRALESVKISHKTTDVNKLPTPMQVVYFALLDEWALWLDEKAPLIERCARDCSDQDKLSIIQSVQQFLDAHPLDSVEHAMKWLRTPQPLLTIGLIALNNNQTDKAKSIFNRVSNEFVEFRAEAFYYLGVIQQRITHRVPSKFDFEKPYDAHIWKNWLFGTAQRDLVATYNSFHESRRHFSMRRLHRGELVTTISQLQQANAALISSNGFRDQHQEYVANHDAIVGNIDKFLGKPIQPDDLRIDGRDEITSFIMHDTLKEFGFLTRTTLAATLHEDQIEFICSRHPISRKELIVKLESLRKTDSTRFENEGRPELETFELRQLFKLPSRLGFWTELRELGVFVEESKYFTTKSCKTIEGLSPVDPKVFNSLEPLLLQFTDVPLDSVKVYKLDDVIAVSNGPQLQILLESGTYATELIAVINPTRLFELDVYMKDFEGFKLNELQDHLGIDEFTAKWIISLYLQDGILEPDVDQVYRFVGIQYTHDLLPDGLNNAVEKFFADRFAYTHALDTVREAFMEATKKPGLQKFLYLPCNPYEDLLNDMIECGIVLPSRVSLQTPRKIDDGHKDVLSVIDDIEDFDKIKDILEANRANIADGDCKLVATEKYINKGTDMNHELKYFTANGLKQVSMVEEDTTWVWLWGITAVLSIVVAVGAVVRLGWTKVGINIAMAAIALAAKAIYKVGSYIYYRVMRTTAKRTVTIDKQANFEYSVLREFNSAALQEDIYRKETDMLLTTVQYGIMDLSNELHRFLTACVKSSINFDGHLKNNIESFLSSPMENIQENPKLHQILLKAIFTAIEQSIKSEFINEEIRLIIQYHLNQIEPNMYATVKSLLSQKPIHQNSQTLTAVIRESKVKMVQIKSEVLEKIIKATCKSFSENFEQLDQICKEFYAAASTLPSTEHVNQNNDKQTSRSNSPVKMNPVHKSIKDICLESLLDHCSEMISSKVSQHFREPLIKRFGAYIRDSTRNNITESAMSKTVRDSDIDAKMQRHTFEKIVQAKTQVEFLENEMEQVCAECWDVRHEQSILRCMIINRYSLPISAAPAVEKAIGILFDKTQPKLGDVSLLLMNKQQQIQYGQKEKKSNRMLQVCLTLHNDRFYSARKSASKAENIGVSSAIYESLCSISEQFAFLFHSADEFVEQLSDCLMD